MTIATYNRNEQVPLWLHIKGYVYSFFPYSFRLLLIIVGVIVVPVCSNKSSAFLNAKSVSTQECDGILAHISYAFKFYFKESLRDRNGF